MSLPDFQPQLSSQTGQFCSTTLIRMVGPTSLPKLHREESLKAQRRLSEFMATFAFERRIKYIALNVVYSGFAQIPPKCGITSSFLAKQVVFAYTHIFVI